MNQGKYVFSQLVEFLDHHKFEDFVTRYDGKELKIERHIYTILQIVGFSLHDKTPVKQLLTNNDYKNVKEQNFNLLLFN